MNKRPWNPSKKVQQRVPAKLMIKYFTPLKEYFSKCFKMELINF